MKQIKSTLTKDLTTTTIHHRLNYIILYILASEYLINMKQRQNNTQPSLLLRHPTKRTTTTTGDAPSINLSSSQQLSGVYNMLKKYYIYYIPGVCFSCGEWWYFIFYNLTTTCYSIFIFMPSGFLRGDRV